MEKYRTFLPRVVALIIDNLVFLPLMLINYLISGLEPTLVLYLWLLIASLAHPFYTFLMHGFYGQTLGKMAMNVKVVNTAEHSINFHQAVLRSMPEIIFNSGAVFFVVLETADEKGSFDSLLGLVFTIVLFLTIIWGIADIFVFIIDEKHRALHDFITGTVVIELNP